MNKRILVSQEEKNSILSMHESFKNREIVMEQKSLTVKDLDGDYHAQLNKNNELIVTTETNYTVNLGTVKNFNEKGVVTITVEKKGGKSIVKYKGKVLKEI